MGFNLANGFTLGIALAIGLIRISSANFEDPEMTFCKFGPKVKALIPETNNKTSGDRCTGSVRVQAVLWECVETTQVEKKEKEFLGILREEARMQCEKHCRNRGKGCRGEVIEKMECGLKTEIDASAEFGKKFGCRKDCTGTSFAYCSLIDAGFRTVDMKLIGKARPNCFCKLESLKK